MNRMEKRPGQTETVIVPGDGRLESLTYQHFCSSKYDCIIYKFNLTNSVFVDDEKFDMVKDNDTNIHGRLYESFGYGILCCEFYVTY